MKDSVKTFLIIALAFYTMMLTAVTTNAQDTTCVMICLDEVINFDFQITWYSLMSLGVVSPYTFLKLDAENEQRI